ncbi:hypothetical protein [Teredinibacter franksiae]|uniref:hypothetical protein n=1 Tax=Teredinibacter franksiae TaxID=2761453 RepID=UPI001FE861D3|nr:hypothetical protein [Teredinibacter franksiae]
MKDIAIIDIEASGLHFSSYPIEVAVLLRGECKSWLIKREPKWQYWCEIAESMHGISRAELEREGLPAFEVAIQLNEFLSESDAVLYSDAQRWDEDWIDTLYFAAKIERHFCVRSIYDLMGSDKAPLFAAQKTLLAESGRYRHHRAAEDVKMIHEAYLYVAG